MKRQDAIACLKAHRGSLRPDEDWRRPAQDRFKGVERVGWSFAFAAIAYNLVRLQKLIGANA